MNNFVDFLYTWQEAIASFLGAFIPIVFAIIAYFLKSKIEKKRNVYFIYKELALIKNNLSEIEETLTKFVTENITQYKNIILDCNSRNIYCASQLYIPAFYIHNVSDRSIHSITGDGYIDEKMLTVIGFQGDLIAQIMDIREQLKDGMDLNKELALNKINSWQENNDQLTENITSLEKMLRDDVIAKNFATYKDILEIAFVACEQKLLHPILWKIRFCLLALWFSGKSKNDKRDVIDSFIKSKIIN